MIDIHLFGITTPTGKYIERIFKNKSEEYNIIGYSRSDKMYKSINFEEENLLIYSNKSILISCAPIWDFASLCTVSLFNGKKKIPRQLFHRFFRVQFLYDISSLVTNFIENKSLTG